MGLCIGNEEIEAKQLVEDFRESFEAFPISELDDFFLDYQLIRKKNPHGLYKLIPAVRCSDGGAIDENGISHKALLLFSLDEDTSKVYDVRLNLVTYEKLPPMTVE